MGIIFKKSFYNKKTFVDVQSQFCSKKNKFNHCFNTFVLGFKNDFSIINLEFFIEQSKRIFLFLLNFISLSTKFLFINLNFSFKNFLSFLSYRCLEPMISQNWINGLLTNCLWIKPHILLASNIKNYVLLQESFIKNLPLVLIDNFSMPLNKYFYFIFGNSFSKKFLYFYYKNLSNFIVLSKLYKNSFEL